MRSLDLNRAVIHFGFNYRLKLQDYKIERVYISKIEKAGPRKDRAIFKTILIKWY